MRKVMLLDREQCFLLIVDMQERLVPKVLDSERVIGNALRLVTAARRVGVPVLMTEHCPAKIGPLVPELRGAVATDAILTKVHFAAAREPGSAARFAALGRPLAVLAGTEAHVCVLQSALSLLDAGYRSVVVSDAISSRDTHDREVALRRLSDAGVGIVTTEMVIFEWLERGDTPEFRELIPIIKTSA
jgi:nicotinamidase-related amidase